MNEQLAPPAAIDNPRFDDPGALDFGQSSAASDGNVKELQIRTTLGRWLSALSLLAMLGVFAGSLVSLARLPGPPPGAAPSVERFFYVHLGLHALVTAAGLYFLYQLLRAGERMMIPAWWDEKAGVCRPHARDQKPHRQRGVRGRLGREAQKAQRALN